MATEREDARGTAMELVAQGEKVLRIENETLLQAALQRPRDEAAIVKAALAELDLVPEMAAKSFYSIPYEDRAKGRVVYVSGPSIKAAMALARRWGNCTVGARIMGEDENGWDLEGVMIDLETNFRIARPFRASKWLKTKAGQTVRLDVQRQMMAVQAAASKAIRNAVLAGLPVYLVASYDAKARAIVGGKLDAPADPKGVAGAVAAFAKLGLQDALAALERHVGKPSKEWTGSDVADLRGLYNSVEDEQITLAEAFGLGPEPPQEPMSKAEGEAAQKTGNEGPGPVGAPRTGDPQVAPPPAPVAADPGQGAPAPPAEAPKEAPAPAAGPPPAQPQAASPEAPQTSPAVQAPAEETPLQYWLRMIAESKSLQEFESWWVKFVKKGGRFFTFTDDEQKRLTEAKERRKGELGGKK